MALPPLLNDVFTRAAGRPGGGGHVDGTSGGARSFVELEGFCFGTHKTNPSLNSRGTFSWIGFRNGGHRGSVGLSIASFAST